MPFTLPEAALPVGTVISPTFRQPPGRARVTLRALIADGDRADANKTLMVRLEYFDDGARAWRTWCGYTWRGSARNLNPSMGTSVGPPFPLCRVRLVTTTPLTTSLVVTDS